MTRNRPRLRGVLLPTCCLLLGAAPAVAALPVADDVPIEPLKAHCRRLLEALDTLKAPLPSQTDKSLRALLGKSGNDPAAGGEIQKLLDARCLIGVSINPESRVKAVRGPAPAELALDRETIVLVKVHNEAGVTHALKVSSPQLRARAAGDADHWLEAQVHARPPMRPTLSGEKVEYVMLRLTAHAAGKREATLRFDVGQGTQDLGFRAEVPVLFTVTK
jgi:hypothetical protein